MAGTEIDDLGLGDLWIERKSKSSRLLRGSGPGVRERREVERVLQEPFQCAVAVASVVAGSLVRPLGARSGQASEVFDHGLDGAELTEDVVAIEDFLDVICDLGAHLLGALDPVLSASVPVVAAVLGQMRVADRALCVRRDAPVVEEDQDACLIYPQKHLLTDERPRHRVGAALKDDAAVAVHLGPLENGR